MISIRNSGFRDSGHFHSHEGYFLLPFRFHPITASREVLVNEVGDWLMCPRGTATRLATHQLAATDPLYSDLLGSFFLSEKPIPDLIDVLATRYRTKKSFLDPFTSLHIFVLTLRCNHTCHYCQVSRQSEDKQQYDMSMEHLSRAIDLMFRSPADSLTVEFQGGEPLLAGKSLTFAVEEILRRNAQYRRKLSFVLCTNLTLLTPDILDFCRRHQILISTSLDGPAFLHRTNRLGPHGADSYAMFERALGQARTALGADRISALMTTSRTALDYPEEIVDAYVALGFSHVFLRQMHPYGFAARLGPSRSYDSAAFLKFYKRALLHVLALNKAGVHVVEDMATIMLKKMLTPFPVGFVDLQSPSGAINGVIVYNYDGYVYASDESRMLAEAGDYTFRLGSVTDQYEDLFYSRQAHQITAASVNEALAGCSDCGFQSYCGGDPVRHHATQGDMEGYRATSSFCAKHLELFRWLFELIDSDTEVERIFRRWVSEGH